MKAQHGLSAVECCLAAAALIFPCCDLSAQGRQPVMGLNNHMATTKSTKSVRAMMITVLGMTLRSKGGGGGRNASRAARAFLARSYILSSTGARLAASFRH
jgi:hypothetical protein